jgi:hypothetical protein
MLEKNAKRRQGSPLWVSEQEGARVLQRVDTKSYDEGWLQRQIHAHPSVLPIWEIEPACWPASPVCMELPLASGPADNLLVNPDGNLVLVECKLWKNPEARRKVIAQIIDYAKDLMALDYTGLEQKIVQGQEVTGKSLYQIAGSTIDEVEFVDAVSRNLRRGRILLVIAGDGITESAESIADYLQQHAGMHFTLALVQLAVYDLGNGDRVVVPSVPIRSVNVVRGIVELRDGRAVIPPPSTKPRAGTLTEEQFVEQLDAAQPGTSERLQELLRVGEDLGLHMDVKKLLIVRLPLGELGPANVLAISPNGDADSSYVWWLRETVGDETIKRFLREWSEAIPGATIRLAPRAPFIKMGDRALTLWDVLDHRDAWLAAVRRFRDAVFDRQRQAESE